jgi:hypothetical protein
VILSGLIFHTGQMSYFTKLSDFPCIEPLSEAEELFVTLAFQVATILGSDKFLFRRRMRMLIPRVSGLWTFPIVLWINEARFRTDTAICVEDCDNFIGELGGRGLLPSFIARRRYYVGLTLQQVDGMDTGRLLYDVDVERLGIDTRGFDQFASQNAAGILSGRIEGTVAYSPKVAHMYAWLPHLVMLILLSISPSKPMGLHDVYFKNLPELIAEKMEQSQSLWLEQNYEPVRQFGRARGGTQEER